MNPFKESFKEVVSIQNNIRELSNTEEYYYALSTSSDYDFQFHIK